MLRLTEGRLLSLYAGPQFHKKVDSSLHEKVGEELKFGGGQMSGRGRRHEQARLWVCGERVEQKRPPPLPQPRVPEREMKWET